MTPQAVFERLRSAFGAEVVIELHAEAGRDPWIDVASGAIARVCHYLRSDPELACDYLECLTGIDYPEEGAIVVVYHLYSYSKKHRVILKISLERADPAAPTVSAVWPAANWQERECFDLLGVRFEGHPDLRRLLLPDDWIGHPLRKDFREQAEYHGIPTTRPNPIELFALRTPGKEPPSA